MGASLADSRIRGTRRPMRFGILGPFEVADDQGRELALGGRKQRSVLAILLLHAGEALSSERLIDELWGERAPRSAANTIHVYVSNLRKALGDGVLVTGPAGYVLRAEEIDAGRFEALAAAGRRALRDGAPGDASEALGRALGLWRGPALADFAYEAFAQSEIARLEEARLAAIEDWIDARLALGEHAELVAELGALVGEHPLRERLHGQLMIALYRCGRQAEALEVFQRARAHLADELGLEPGPALKALQAQILSQDARLAPGGLAGDGAHISSSLLERSAELTTLSDRLEEVREGLGGRLVLVRGEAGIGKTMLLRRFCDGLGAPVRVLWATCDPLFLPRPLGPLLDIARSTDGELRQRIETGAKPHDVAAALIRELASPDPTVLVLEDLHWADEATLDVLRLVSRRVQTIQALLVASYRDEELGRLHPLRTVLGELPSSDLVTRLEPVGLSRAAVSLLAETSPIDPDALYDRTLGNPFFVTEALAARTELVPGTVRDAVLVRAARLGSAAARALLDAVAIVPQRVEMWLLEAMLEDGIESLDECLASGMLTADPDRIGFRHELARLAIEESLSPDRRRRLHRRALAALLEPGVGTVDLARVTHHAEGAGDAAAVLRFAPAAAEEAGSVGAHREAASQYSRALRFAHTLAPEARADLLERFAHECYLTDMRLEALHALDEALSIHRRRHDVVRQGAIQNERATLLGCAGRHGEAGTAAVEAVALLEQAPPRFELARAYATLAGIHLRADEADEAVSWGLRAIALAERTGDAKAMVQALNLVGTIELSRGVQAGRGKLERSLQLAREAGLANEAGLSYINLVSALSRRHEWTLAAPYIDAGMAFCRDHGLEAWLTYMTASRAECALAQGRWSDAASTAISILDAPLTSVIGPRFMSLRVLALVRARRGEPGSWPLLDEMLALARTVGELQYLAPAAAARAEAAWLDERADAIRQETGWAFGLALELREPTFLSELACWRRRGGVIDQAPAGATGQSGLWPGEGYQAAITFWREHGCPYEAALALADTGDQNLLHQACGELQALGARRASAIVAGRLRVPGERDRRRAPAGAAGGPEARFA